MYTSLVRPWWRTAYFRVIAPSSAGSVTVAAGSSVVEVYDVAESLVSGSDPSVVYTTSDSPGNDGMISTGVPSA